MNLNRTRMNADFRWFFDKSAFIRVYPRPLSKVGGLC